MSLSNKAYENIIKFYTQALKDNNYQKIIDLFSKDAKVFSILSGEHPPSIFFQDLFRNTRRNKVEIKNIFLDLNNKKMMAAYIYLEAIWNNQSTIQFEAVDIFEFDQEDKIKYLRTILDTHLIRKLKEKYPAIDALPPI